MATTILKVSKGAAGRETVTQMLRDAGIGVIEVEDWEQAAEALRGCQAALVVCDGEALEPGDSAALGKALAVLAEAPRKEHSRLPPDVARALSHELRTPLSAMAGWLHLMESGKLDAEGLKRAITKLRGNIEEEVRTIDRYLGTTNGGRS